MSHGNDRDDLLERTILMARAYLMDEIYHDADAAELSEQWVVSQSHVRVLTSSGAPFMIDLLEILQHTKLDFGIAIRDPSSGKEITFFAANNLSGEQELARTTEEVINYAPRAAPTSGLDFLIRHHPLGTPEDGDYTITPDDNRTPPNLIAAVDRVVEKPGSIPARLLLPPKATKKKEQAK